MTSQAASSCNGQAGNLSLLCEALDALPVGYLVVDRSGAVVFVNRWLADKLAQDRGKLRGLSYIVAFGLKNDRRLTRVISACLESDRAAFLSHYLNRSPFPILDNETGRRLPHSISVAPLGDGKAGEKYCLIEVRDRSAEVQREAQLRRQAMELERACEDLSHVLYAASHDLKQPIRSITTLVQMLEEDEADNLTPVTRRYLDRIRQATERSSDLMKGILDYSQLDARSGDVHCDAEEIMRELAAQFEPLLEVHHGQLIFEGLPRVAIGRIYLFRLLQNLIGNAIAYRSEVPPNIRVEARSEGDFWHFTVRDNGIGIQPEYREKVFELFQRLHRYDEVPGTGLGLAMCRKIVESAGGRMWIDENSENGTIFHFTLQKSV